MMSASVFDKRPPFVRFEEREVGLNVEATEEAGRPVPKVVFIACVTSHGSKDVFEKVADDWLADKKRQAMDGTFPVEWYNRFALQFTEWKSGHELPREGTPIKTWAMASREQITRLLGNGITTVEDLAAFPDSNLAVVGMDGRYLRDIARGWISEAKDKGETAKALADANVQIENLKATVAAQTERINRLAARLEEEPPARTGKARKPSENEAA